MNVSNKLKNRLGVLLCWITISFNQSCGNPSFGQQADSLYLETSQVTFYYDLKRPAEKHFLPYVLSEISGLAYKAKEVLLAVDDETGKIFEYDIQNRKIVHSIEFARSDDYEGVEIVDSSIYVLRSDGDLFKFSYVEDKRVKSEKIENELGGKNDTEGLGYDNQTNCLLIACKEQGGIDDKKVKGRTVYEYDLAEHKLKKNPLFTVGPKELSSFWEVTKKMEYDKSRIKFKPSAIAIHPLSGDYYLLSSVGKLLVVINRAKDIKATYPIHPRVLGQPEGLCFAANGDLYISSEGEGDRGYILKFPMKKK